MRVLVTNDDGIDAPGLRVLIGAAARTGAEVTVLAPLREFSGASASLVAHPTDGRLAVQRRDPDDLGVHRVLVVDASPAYLAMIAVQGAFGEPPDVVLSGVNHGPNTGAAVLHSGTVGAALTAWLHGGGIRAMALSSAATRPEHWAAVDAVADRCLSWLLTTDAPRGVLNVNVPDVGPGAVRGLWECALARAGAVQAAVGDSEDAVDVVLSIVDPSSEPGTDIALLAQGYATATLLHPTGAGSTSGLGGLVDQTSTP